MEHTMFCFQCEQTVGCTGCTGKAGACGKSAGTAKLQDELTGALIGLARATDHAPGVNAGTWQLLIEGLFTTVTSVSFHNDHPRDDPPRARGKIAARAGLRGLRCRVRTNRRL